MYLKGYHIIGFIFTVILGTLLHFTYQLSGNNIIVGYFSAINESTWEHLKLLITPVIIFSIFEYFIYGKNINNFILLKALTMLLGMFVIVASFYTYTGILGNNYLPLDIGTFILGTFTTYYFSYRFIQKRFLYNKNINYIGLFIIAFVIFCMIYFTTNPPKIKLFLDPQTNTYGVQ
ncbi:DUF6512 family protein [uncultured Tyzzerella sp.]|uniref:DUF6512 family protein n=1 Tax=uncultured Tyzzerella sp. TaxID=2321398 RepID=UPI00294224B5|nr:DUF6512 family protein [uncultured Tyzzerella sp.]